MKTKMQKGQLFSLDFVIAMGIVALSIGMLLNYYETAAVSEKEIRMQNELAAVALNSSALILQAGKCVQFGTAGIGTLEFIDQNYPLYGCADPTNGGWATFSKQDLMVPTEFSCNISWYNQASPGTVTTQSSGCTATVPSGTNLTSIDRNFLVPVSSPITKRTYERCVYGNLCSGIYSKYTLTVKVWK